MWIICVDHLFRMKLTEVSRRHLGFKFRKTKQKRMDGGKKYKKAPSKFQIVPLCCQDNEKINSLVNLTVGGRGVQQEKHSWHHLTPHHLWHALYI